MRFGNLIYILLLCLITAGCATYMQPFESRPAKIGAGSQENEGLKSLPEPREKIVAAVYRFRDQSGQYKMGANFSTAVTQGSTSILMRSLEESGWFTPIEREGLSNLLNERQIIQSIRSQHTDQQGNQLPPISPLLYAGVLLEGGIISYDTNVITGGLGFRYFGAGGSGEFRQDQVTIYLRAISTQNGRVLKTVYTTKTILSQKIDGSLFRFVTPNRLLETEAGYSFNEPTTIAVTEAIEKAVKSLIVEGIEDGLWNLNNQEDYYSESLERYREEVNEDFSIDYGRALAVRPQGLSVGFTAGGQMYEGSYANSILRPSAEISLGYQFRPAFGLGLQLSRGNIAAEGIFEKSLNAAELYGTWHLLSRQRISPFLMLGGGMMNEDSGLFEFTQDHHPYATGGFGIELLISGQVGAMFMIRNNYTIRDGLDGITGGTINDNIWRGQLGLTWYLGRN